MPFANEIKDLFSFSKTVLSFSTPFLFLEKKIFKQNAFLAHFGCALCALDEVVVYKKHFDSNVYMYAYERP
jgi:hypothetical protein